MAAKRSSRVPARARVKAAPATKRVASTASAKKPPAKKPPAKKPPAKKPPAKKPPAKKPSAKKPSARKISTKSASPSAARAPSKISARRAGKTVADYLGALPASQQAAAAAVRAILREAAPQATESIKWGQPVYEQGGPFAYLKTAKSHLTFGFWRGTELTDPGGLLQGAGDRMRHLKLTSEAIPTTALRAFVEQAVALNAERGDPTRRG